MVTDPFDNTGSLMTEDRRKRRGQLSVSARNVGMADADPGNPDEHVRVLELRELDLFDDERAAQAVNDRGCSLHGKERMVRDRPGQLHDGIAAVPSCAATHHPI